LLNTLRYHFSKLKYIPFSLKKSHNHYYIYVCSYEQSKYLCAALDHAFRNSLSPSTVQSFIIQCNIWSGWLLLRLHLFRRFSICQVIIACHLIIQYLFIYSRLRMCNRLPHTFQAYMFNYLMHCRFTLCIADSHLKVWHSKNFHQILH
jgi:hypothetical protein